ncbi:hypothetical protein C5U37_11260 [Escherichia fergusonii]|nr:hypothetical protein DKG79_15200 [Escherichia fergusonii]PQI95275.1 hypothetical protein C5U38_16210 [Escherichia fergusonii]PQJ01550.1 hypothetical protein C5U37_11260 [Escherichia fergusonii]
MHLSFDWNHSSDHQPGKPAGKKHWLTNAPAAITKTCNRSVYKYSHLVHTGTLLSVTLCDAIAF